MPDKYCIKDGYVSQKHAVTLSKKDTDLYWTDQRILTGHYFLYSVYKFAREIAKKHGARNAIDLGCGIAFKLMELIYPVCRGVTGVDQKEAIDYCRKTYQAGNFIVDNLDNPSAKPGIFDLVICCDAIEHLLDPDRLVEYIREISHNNSFIVLSTPERDIVRGKDCMGSPKPEHVREWNREEFAAYLQSRGLKILEHKLCASTRFSFNRIIINTIISTIRRSGTLKINQLVLCQKS